MSEEKKTTEKPEKKENPKSGNVVKAKETPKKVEKVRWTVERCMKYARRYQNENVWSASAPSSYKSAAAHGWLNQCLAAMGTTSGKVLPGKFARRSEHASPAKKAA